MQLRTSHAHEEGCDRQWSISTTKFTGHNGQVTKLHANKVKFEAGKFVPVPNSDFEMDADLVLLAMGFTGPVKNECHEVRYCTAQNVDSAPKAFGTGNPLNPLKIHRGRR